MDRRDVLKAMAAAAAAPSAASLARASRPSTAGPSTLTFDEVPRGQDARMHCPPGYRANVVVAWGDPLFGDAPAFAPMAQSRDAQERQFGYANDFIAFVPLPTDSGRSDRGLLCVNHESSNAAMMFPGLRKSDGVERVSRGQVAVEMAAHGHSVVEVRREKGGWKIVRDGAYNRRLSASSTWMRLSGPAAGHRRMRTRGDGSGRRVLGTLADCGGGVTPWGTVLFCEENWNEYFQGDPAKTGEARNHLRYQVGSELYYGWYRYHDRFRIERDPHEANRFGWVVEYDPLDPFSVPTKRTALGRCKHEAAVSAVSGDGRVAVYSGDDDDDEYVYRFVTKRPFDAERPASNRDLLDEGVLYAARFDEGGSLTWLPLVHGRGPLTKANGFDSQADVLIETRRAADLVGATPMDRPEGMAVHPGDGRVFVMLTKGPKRTPEDVDPANPRHGNRFGHALEMLPPLGADGRPDHGATEFGWRHLFLGGDPSVETEEPGQRARFHPATSADGWLTNPDNCAVDARGRLWVATDGQLSAVGCCDGIYACDSDGEGRALTRCFFRAPLGAEVCSPCFTPDGSTLFTAVQHPGTGDGVRHWTEFSFDDPSCRFPDYAADGPPRPAVVAIVREDGGSIGS